LVRMICLRRGGWVGVHSGQDSIPAVGAVFTAVLGRVPVDVRENPDETTGTDTGARERERA